MLLLNVGTAVPLFLLGSYITTMFPAVPLWTIYVVGAGAILNIVFIIFLFGWKKWAFFAFCATSGIIFLINFLVGGGIESVLGLIEPLVLWLLLRSKWNYLE